MKRIMLIALLLQGCIYDDVDINYPDVMYVGDSLCAQVYDVKKAENINYVGREKQRYREQQTAQNMVGIKTNCVKGRGVTEITRLPKGYRVMFLALVTNDVGNTDIDVFRAKYQELVYNNDSEILYCVLPDDVIGGKDSSEYRQVIEETCANTIDPADYGVKFRADDTVHMTKADHRKWVKAIRERI